MTVNNNAFNVKYKDEFKIAAKNMVGSIMMYELDVTDDSYNVYYMEPLESDINSNPPRMVLKALKSFYEKTGISYSGMVDRMYDVLIRLSASYEFHLMNEKLSIKDGVLVFESGNSEDMRLKRLVRLGISQSETWEIDSNNIINIEKYIHSSRPNFISDAYSNFFAVNSEIKTHIIDNLPDINFPSYLIESYVYLKSLQMPKYHSQEQCAIANEIYNRSIQKQSSKCYPIEHNLIINQNLDVKAKNEKIHEPLLFLFLTFSVSCKPEEIVWEAIKYESIIKLYQNILSYKDEKNIPMVGRIVGSDFYKSVRKASYMMIKDKVEFSQNESKIFTGSDYEENNKDSEVEIEILRLMSSNLPSSMWDDGAELPASWLALL